jgi:hypothetical protein
MRSYLFLVLAAALGGCTTQLGVMTPATTGPGKGPINGWSYNLARLDYEIDIARTLTTCPGGADETVGFDFAATAVSAYGPGEEVIVDYTRLGNAWKTTSVSFENYPDGILKSVNAKATDQTAAGIKAGVDVAVGIAKLAIGTPAIAAAGVKEGPPTPQWTARAECTSLATNLTKVLKAAGDTRDQTAKTRDEAKATLDAFDADHPEADKSDAAKADRAKLATAQRTTAKAALEAEKALAKAKEPLTFHARPQLAFDGPTQAEAALGPAEAGPFFARMFQVRLSQPGQPDQVWPVLSSLSFPQAGTASQREIAKGAVDAVINPAAVQIDFRARRATPGALGVANAVACDPMATSSSCGILYRTLTPARLQICKLTRTVDCGGLLSGDGNILLRDEKNAPQLGGLRSLPLRNGPFEDNNLQATFREDSSIATLTYAKTSAEAVAALTSAGDVVKGLTDVDLYRRQAALRGPANATALAKARADLDDALAKEIQSSQALRDAQAKYDAATAAAAASSGGTP